MKNKTPHDVDPQDISGRMFRQALLDAYDRVGKNNAELERALGLKVGSCKYWVQGGNPPYRKMQEMYFRLLDIKPQA